MPQDIVLSSDDLDELLEQARGQITNSNQTVAEAERKVISENIARMGRDRSWISISIIVTYAVAVISALAYLLWSAPVCSVGGDSECASGLARWEAQVGMFQDLIVTAVLPIVTLMLGFYFGTETARSSKPDN